MTDHIVIGINGEKYGLAISDVQEIIKLLPVTDIPGVSPYIEGVINLRGRIVPVIGMRARFGQPAGAMDEASRIVIVNASEGEAVGLLVDNVMQVVSFAEVLPPPNGVGGGNRMYLRGIGKMNDQLISLLDLGKVLGTGESDR